jgi:hypothetical protein
LLDPGLVPADLHAVDQTPDHETALVVVGDEVAGGSRMCSWQADVLARGCLRGHETGVDEQKTTATPSRLLRRKVHPPDQVESVSEATPRRPSG